MSKYTMKSVVIGFIAPHLLFNKRERQVFGRTIAAGDKSPGDITVKPPPDPALLAREAANLAGVAGQARIEGSQATLVTGQSGVAGQAKTKRPVLLGG